MAMATAKQHERNPVEVKWGRAEITVDVEEYHPLVAQRLARVPGAEFDGERKVWAIPPKEKESVKEALQDIKDILGNDRDARIDVEHLSAKAAREVLRENGTPDAQVRQSDFRNLDRPTYGPILASNGFWAAQLTGFGKEDGAAFVSLHRTAELEAPVFKGERVSIRYPEKGHKGKARVEAMAPDFAESLGKRVDGVKVVDAGDRFQVSFDYNHDLIARINRIAGAKIQGAGNDRYYEVPKDKEEFLRRAVADMRKEFLLDKAAWREVEKIANAKLDGAKLIRPLQNDGPPYSGEIVGKNERYVVQHTGREFFTGHRVGDLDKPITVGDKVKIVYQKGRGAVTTKAQEREAGHGR